MPQETHCRFCNRTFDSLATYTLHLATCPRRSRKKEKPTGTDRKKFF